MTGPANPNAFPACNEANLNDTMGMTLRDWFAGQALAGICAASIGHMIDGSNESTLAYGAYVIADEMLAAREQGKASIPADTPIADRWDALGEAIEQHGRDIDAIRAAHRSDCLARYGCDIFEGKSL